MVLGDNSIVLIEVKKVNFVKIGVKDGSKFVYSGFVGNLGGLDIEGNLLKVVVDK